MGTAQSLKKFKANGNHKPGTVSAGDLVHKKF